MDSSRLSELLAANGREAATAIERFLTVQAEAIVALARVTLDSQARGGKVLVFGNGGSAADAQHLAAELVGRFLEEREPLAAIALTVDTSVLTCLANDYGYANAFARQVRALAGPADVVIALSTSGRSENVLEGLRAAKERGCHTVGLTGSEGPAMESLCDTLFKAPTSVTPRIQECHIAWVHAYCEAVEKLHLGWKAD